jgi:DNA-binding transcriptional LysR family regulator
VIAMRDAHPLAEGLDLDAYCRAEHVVMSAAGDPQANIDDDLQAVGRSRRVAVTAPNMLLGLSLVGESDLLMAAPSQLVERYSPAMGLTFREPPISLQRFEIGAVIPQAAPADLGVTWLMGVLEALYAG